MLGKHKHMQEQEISLHKNESRDIIIDAAARDQKIFCTVKEGAQLALTVSGYAKEAKKIEVTVVCESASSAHIVQKTSGSISVAYRIVLNGENSQGDLVCAFRTTGDDAASIDAWLVHEMPNTKGNIKIKGVCEEKSRAFVSGMIKVEKAAQKTASYFRDDILLFDDAMADSLPNLEIEANDVKASHGSTTSRINDEQLLYLRSRGIALAESRRLIIEGFLAL